MEPKEQCAACCVHDNRGGMATVLADAHVAEQIEKL